MQPLPLRKRLPICSTYSSLSNCLPNLIIYRASIKSNLKNYSVFVIFFEAVLYNIKVGKLLSLFFFSTNYSPNDWVTFLSFTQGALFAVIKEEKLTGVIIQRRKFLQVNVSSLLSGPCQVQQSPQSVILCWEQVKQHSHYIPSGGRPIMVCPHFYIPML